MRALKICTELNATEDFKSQILKKRLKLHFILFKIIGIETEQTVENLKFETDIF